MIITDELDQFFGEYPETDRNVIGIAIKLLSASGYAPTAKDAELLSLCERGVISHIEAFCSIEGLPEKLVHQAARRICGEFLDIKHTLGELDIGQLDFGAALKEITEGDSTVKFAAGFSNAEKFSALVKNLKECGKDDLICFRKIKW